MILLLLTGCQMPFTTPQKSQSVNYIESNAHILSASQTIDRELVKMLIGAEKEKKGFTALLNDVIYTRKMQQQLYDTIKFEYAPLENQKLKYYYLKMINSRIKSYNTFIEVLNESNYQSLKKIAEIHVEKDKDLENKMLAQVNGSLKILSEKERFTLLPLEKERCHAKEVEEDVVDENENENENEQNVVEGDNNEEGEGKKQEEKTCWKDADIKKWVKDEDKKWRETLESLKK